MDESIGFEDINRDEKNTPHYIKVALIMLIVLLVITSVLMYLFLSTKEQYDVKKKENIDELYYLNQRNVLITSKNDGMSSYIDMADSPYEIDEVRTDSVLKTTYIIAKRKEEVVSGSNEEHLRKISANVGVCVTDVYGFCDQDMMIVELNYDDYYDYRTVIEGQMVTIECQSMSQDFEKEVVIIDISGNDREYGRSIANLINADDKYEIVVIGDEIKRADNESKKTYIDRMSASYYIGIATDLDSTRSSISLKAICNSRYFIPKCNSVVLSSSIINEASHSRLFKIEGIEECTDGDIIKMLKIPACRVDISYGNYELDEMGNDKCSGTVADILSKTINEL